MAKRETLNQYSVEMNIQQWENKPLSYFMDTVIINTEVTRGTSTPPGLGNHQQHKLH